MSRSLLLDLRERLAVWLFPKFGADWQDMKARLASETALKVEAQDRARELADELRRANEELAASRKETTHAVMLVGDWFSQQMFGRKIFSAAPDLPEQRQTPELVAKRQQGRAICEEMERRFFEGLAAEPPAREASGA
jgi:hypothetical protein